MSVGAGYRETEDKISWWDEIPSHEDNWKMDSQSICSKRDLRYS